MVSNVTLQQLVPQIQQPTQVTSTQDFFSLLNQNPGNFNQTLPQAVQQQLFANQNQSKVDRLYQQFRAAYQNLRYVPCQKDG